MNKTLKHLIPACLIAVAVSGSVLTTSSPANASATDGIVHTPTEFVEHLNWYRGLAIPKKSPVSLSPELSAYAAGISRNAASTPMTAASLCGGVGYGFYPQRPANVPAGVIDVSMTGCGIEIQEGSGNGFLEGLGYPKMLPATVAENTTEIGVGVFDDYPASAKNVHRVWVTIVTRQVPKQAPVQQPVVAAPVTPTVATPTVPVVTVPVVTTPPAPVTTVPEPVVTTTVPAPVTTTSTVPVTTVPAPSTTVPVPVTTVPASTTIPAELGLVVPEAAAKKPAVTKTVAKVSKKTTKARKVSKKK